MKGTVDLIKVKAVEAVDVQAFEKPHCFQVFDIFILCIVLTQTASEKVKFIVCGHEENLLCRVDDLVIRNFTMVYQHLNKIVNFSTVD